MLNPEIGDVRRAVILVATAVEQVLGVAAIFGIAIIQKHIQTAGKAPLHGDLPAVIVAAAFCCRVARPLSEVGKGYEIARLGILRQDL